MMAGESRGLLPSAIAEHIEGLAHLPGDLGRGHREAGEALAAWIVENWRPGRPLGVVVICTGNSRRSILGSTMGNIAAAHCGLPEVRFYSGGTDPTAFDPRTIATLRRIGVEVEATGEPGDGSEPRPANPVYWVRWGTPGVPALEALESSKRYDDPANPPSGFAALMVCDGADLGCPAVRGAALRLSMPFPDPKSHDNTPEEASRYDERRDEIGRLLLFAMMQARSRLAGEVGRSPAGP